MKYFIDILLTALILVPGISSLSETVVQEEHWCDDFIAHRNSACRDEESTPVVEEVRIDEQGRVVIVNPAGGRVPLREFSESREAEPADSPEESISLWWSKMTPSEKLALVVAFILALVAWSGVALVSWINRPS